MPIELPEEFLHRMQDLLKGEFDDFVAIYKQTPPTGLRVNALKIEPEKFEEISPWQLSPVPWSPSGFLLHGDERPGKHPYHAAGLYYLQEPSAMAVAELMKPKPGERILDLAAAPGGKATHLAALMKNSGFLLANDMNPRRVRYLINNFERWGVSNISITQERPHRLAKHFGASFDRVLLDAPCSGEGMFRKDPSAVQMWSQKLVRTSAERQINLMATAAKLVRPGGLLVYTTCTFNPDENEAVVSVFNKSHHDFELIKLPKLEGFSPGQSTWIENGNEVLNRAVRIWPHKSVGEGHFIAVFHKTDGEDRRIPAWKPQDLVKKDRKLVDDFWQKHMTGPIPMEWRFSLQGNRVYLIHDDTPDLRGLHVLHWGVWLGTLKKARFEPAHPMIMTLPEEMFREVLNLGSDSEDARAYLRAETLDAPGPAGWIRVCVDGYPLGWGKRVGDRIKSHSPRWLRNIY